MSDAEKKFLDSIPTTFIHPDGSRFDLLIVIPQAEGLPCMLDTDTAITKERVIDLNIIRDRISLGDWDPHYLMKK